MFLIRWTTDGKKASEKAPAGFMFDFKKAQREMK